MRRLLNTLFVLTEDSYLSLDGENVVLNREKAEMARFPLHTLLAAPAVIYSSPPQGRCNGERAADRGLPPVFFAL